MTATDFTIMQQKKGRRILDFFCSGCGNEPLLIAKLFQHTTIDEYYAIHGLNVSNVLVKTFYLCTPILNGS
jgi:hypothetical protein